jgi:hypothetical protein
MSNYLVVAHQTADSDALIMGVRAKSEKEHDARFVLLVPATAIEDLLEPPADTSVDRHDLARQVGEDAAEVLRGEGVKIVATKIGDSNPLTAIGDELRATPDHYQGIIISTLPTGLSHWLRNDLPSQVGKRFHVPVTHVVEDARVFEEPLIGN